jgi:hypothetical protein
MGCSTTDDDDDPLYYKWISLSLQALVKFIQLNRILICNTFAKYVMEKNAVRSFIKKISIVNSAMKNNNTQYRGKSLNYWVSVGQK